MAIRWRWEIPMLMLSSLAASLTPRSFWDNPKNMLMIIGKWDEFRQRMTGTRDIEKEWMSSAQTKKAIPVANPQIGVTYGDFEQGRQGGWLCRGLSTS